jgi:hypothetical protein
MFNGYFLSFKKNNNNSKASEHLLQNGHSFGKINDIMEILSLPKGTRLDTGEKVYICNESATEN